MASQSPATSDGSAAPTSEIPTESSKIPASDPSNARADSSVLERLRHIIAHAGHLLPAQGPITVFIHHNTLHAYEHLPFFEGVEVGSRKFGCEPYLSEDRYRAELRRGRIRFHELDQVLNEDPRHDDAVALGRTRFELRRTMLQYSLPSGTAAEMHWFIAERDALRTMRADAPDSARTRLIAETRRWVMRDLRVRRGDDSRAGNDLADELHRVGDGGLERWDDREWEAFGLHLLWRICLRGAAYATDPPAPPEPYRRHRDDLLQLTGDDADRPVADLLIRFCSAFLDQGLAAWPLPSREQGFLACFVGLYGRRFAAVPSALSRLSAEIERIADKGMTALEVAAESLTLLEVPPAEWEEYVSATLLSLRGWAGMVRQISERGDRISHSIAADSLTEFLAVRLLLDRLSLRSIADRRLGRDVRPSQWAERARSVCPKQAIRLDHEIRAFAVFQIAQLLDWCPHEMHLLKSDAWRRIYAEVESFTEIDRRRTFQIAYERRFINQTLDAISIHDRDLMSMPERPHFQVLSCIDEREESLRRHIEELAPGAETYGIPGFYFIPMYYRGAEDAHYVPLCPPVMRPANWVVERVEGSDLKRVRMRRTLGLASHYFHTGSRNPAAGAILSLLIGILMIIPLVCRTLFPRKSARMMRRANGLIPPPPARQKLERTADPPAVQGAGIGFSTDEMTTMAERILRDTGLTRRFSRFVITLGHGSTSMNNPHESAHDCGACGGAQGGPNGRAAAAMLNDSRVRDRLRVKGIDIPADTIFVGGMHNTSSDEIIFYDRDLIPPDRRSEFDNLADLMDRACDRDAHERCRRFESAALRVNVEGARRHVEGRAQDLAQVRPEWGHATNAVCIVGRRMRSRGLFLDRRAFLISCDPTQDDAEGMILSRILSAAVPVCAGISLEYYFSHVDNRGYGCGTKLPHNITSLLGVMDGAASDLRTGLPWQMVEIHEPMRIIFVIETTPEILSGFMERNTAVGRLIKNGWVHAAVLDPDSAQIRLYSDGQFVPHDLQTDRLPRAGTSIDWYRGWREHLEFAEIGG